MMTNTRRRSLRMATAAACALALVPAAAAQAENDNDAPTDHRAHLMSSTVPSGGDELGYGDAVVRLVKDEGDICWDVSWSNLSGTVTGIHLHKGAAGEDGPHALEMLDDATLPGDSGSEANCMSPDSDKKIDDILAEPSAYYVQIHTSEHEKGALRGQLDPEEEVNDS